ncbi:hypothetical protein OEZ85_005811 [Tetradesmus obliquus]|uniref:Uncharacterized protein n=1 Tax=Tetradesmus obliquus TaxID=3088 RepID=A0ABY8UIC6_TETOB|nr:hypothetical protein OEZ85_005811 [Tetradesmus obliquus]
MADVKQAIKAQVKAMIPGTSEHKARAAGDPAYHLGNVGSNHHHVHTGYGLTGKMQPKVNKVKQAKASTKGKVSEHAHGLHSHKDQPAAAAGGQPSSGMSRAAEKPAFE